MSSLVSDALLPCAFCCHTEMCNSITPVAVGGYDDVCLARTNDQTFTDGAVPSLRPAMFTHAASASGRISVGRSRRPRTCGSLHCRDRAGPNNGSIPPHAGGPSTGSGQCDPRVPTACCDSASGLRLRAMITVLLTSAVRKLARRSRRIHPLSAAAVAAGTFCLAQLLIVTVTTALHLAHLL